MKRRAPLFDSLEAVHVVPLDDLRHHEPTMGCWCCPVEDEGSDGVFVHNALDGRERYESGELRLH